MKQVLPLILIIFISAFMSCKEDSDDDFIFGYLDPGSDVTDASGNYTTRPVSDYKGFNLTVFQTAGAQTEQCNSDFTGTGAAGGGACSAVYFNTYLYQNILYEGIGVNDKHTVPSNFSLKITRVTGSLFWTVSVTHSGTTKVATVPAADITVNCDEIQYGGGPVNVTGTGICAVNIVNNINNDTETIINAGGVINVQKY